MLTADENLNLERWLFHQKLAACASFYSKCLDVAQIFEPRRSREVDTNAMVAAGEIALADPLSAALPLLEDKV